LLVRTKEPPSINTQFPIWEIPGSKVLHERRQVWAHWVYAVSPRIQHGRRRAFIHYADLAALMVMLDLKVGGGVMDAVNKGQRLVRPRIR